MLLSIKAEGLFYLSFCVVLGLWVKVEECVREEEGRGASGGLERAGRVEVDGGGGGEDGGRIGGKEVEVEKKEDGRGLGGWNPMGMRGDDLRIAMFFLFFVQVGFFGTGK